MLMDSATLVCGGTQANNNMTPQNVFATNASVLSANSLDLASGGAPAGQVRDMGGATVAMHVRVGTAFAGGTSAEFQVITADDPALATNVQVLGTSDAIPVAKLTQGTVVSVGIAARPRVNGQRYLGARVVNVGANTAGGIYAWFGTSETSDPGKLPQFGTGFGVA